MFERQSIGDWLPQRYQRWTPLLVSLLITPFAWIVGVAGFGPEGHWFSVGSVIFPWTATLFLAAGFLNNVPMFYVSIFLTLLQYPFYGFLLSLGRSRRAVLVSIFTSHALVVVGIFAFVFIVRSYAHYM